MAQAQWQAAAKAQGLTGVTSWTDIELTVLTGKVSGSGSDTARSGAQISVKLPVFDSGDMQRAQMNAQTLAATHQLQATAQQAASTLREAHAAYLTAYSIARRYKDELLPLRQRIADENLLRYNAMQIGVFDLLTDAAEQSTTVSAAIDALQQFWLSEAALHATLIGRPLNTQLSISNNMPASSAATH
jgi:outer membrane protein TolC